MRLWYASLLPLLAYATSAWALEIQPAPALQAQLARAAAAENELEFQHVLDEIKASASSNYDDLIPQLVYAVVHAKERREALVPSVIIRRLGISKAQVSSSLQPYRSTTDARVRVEIDNLLNQ